MKNLRVADAGACVVRIDSESLLVASLLLVVWPGATSSVLVGIRWNPFARSYARSG